MSTFKKPQVGSRAISITAPISNSKITPIFKLRNLILEDWRADKNYFLGRVLTIIDASIPDPIQRKGIKDLINDAFYNSNSDHREQTFRLYLKIFAKRYCKDMFPNGENDEFSFLGQCNPKAVINEDIESFYSFEN